MLVGLAPPQDGLEVGRRGRQDDLVALDKVLLVTGERDVVEVVLETHLLQQKPVLIWTT